MEKAKYIRYASQSIEVSQKFYREITTLSEKLSYVATAYDDHKFHIYTLKNGHSIKFIVDGDYVYISEFIAKGREFII